MSKTSGSVILLCNISRWAAAGGTRIDLEQPYLEHISSISQADGSLMTLQWHFDKTLLRTGPLQMGLRAAGPDRDFFRSGSRHALDCALQLPEDAVHRA